MLCFIDSFIDCSLCLFSISLFINLNYTGLEKYGNSGPHELCCEKVCVSQRVKGVFRQENMSMSEKKGWELKEQVR